jgi:hypothetical protein
MGVTQAWLYDGKGEPPEPAQWDGWLARIPVEIVPAKKPRRGVKAHLAAKEKAAKGGGRRKGNGKAG